MGEKSKGELLGYSHQGCDTSIGIVSLKDASLDIRIYRTIGVVGFVFVFIFNVIASFTLLQVLLRPVRRGGSLGSYEPPSTNCGKQKSEPNHFVAVQDLIEGSELEASLEATS